MIKKILSLTLCLLLSACNFSCAGNQITQKKEASTAINPPFDENLAWSQILAYEKIGPKVPGTPAQDKGGDWIVSELKKLNLKALEQKSTAKTFDGKTIPFRNIMAQINPDAKTRYLLSAHWDNRPWADQDANPKYHKTPIQGTNDGGSGVVVLLGIAKSLLEQKATFGVDFLFLDAEDWGSPTSEDGYCIGTKYWVTHPVPENYHAKFGVNYDMVGRIGSIFPAESNSAEKAPEVLRKLRAAAKKLGYAELFPDLNVGPIIDDHIYLMERGFPVYDMIYMTPEGRFPPEWHTHLDTSEFISRDVLKAVGRTTLQMLWDDQPADKS